MESVRVQQLLAEQAAAFDAKASLAMTTLEAKIAEKDAEAAKNKSALAEKDAEAAKNKAALEAKLAERDAIIREYERKTNQDPSFITPSGPRFNPWAHPAPSSVHSSNSKLSLSLQEDRLKQCQITDLKSVVKGNRKTVVAAHLWPRRHADLLSAIAGISHEIDSVKNGIFLAKPIEHAFDRLEACFLVTSLRGDIIFKVLDRDTNKHRNVAPEGCPDLGTVLDWNNKPLKIRGDSPSKTILSAHATFALEHAMLKGWITKKEYDEWMPFAKFHSPPEKSASSVITWLQSSPGYGPGAAPLESKAETTPLRADIAASAEGFEASDMAANDPDRNAGRLAARPGALGGEARSLHQAFAAVAETRPAAAAPRPGSAAGYMSRVAKSRLGRAPITTAGGERSGSISAGPGSGAGSDGCSAAATAAAAVGGARSIDDGARPVSARAGTAAAATAAAAAAVGAATDRPGPDEEIRRTAGARDPAPGPARASARAQRPGGGRAGSGLAVGNGARSEAPPAKSAPAASAAKGGPRRQRLLAAAASSRGAAGGRLSAADSDGRAGGAGAGLGTARAGPTGRAYSARAGPDPVGRLDREVAVGPVGRAGAQDARPAVHWKGPALLVTRLLQEAGAGPRVLAGSAAGRFTRGPASAAPGDGARETGGRG